MPFTAKQQSAIDERSKTLLVSAAAGSGKTATLTERIIQSITGEESADISKMLIVTFTRAAAKELRDRISGAIAKRLESDPDNRHLARQALLVPTAHICTIDSFCNDILSNNAAKAGISANYRICDEAEGNLLARIVMEKLINECYDGECDICTPESFARFADDIQNNREDSALSEKLFSIYRLTDGLYDRIGSLFPNGRITDDYTEFFDTFFGKSISVSLKAMLEHYIAMYGKALDNLSLGSEAAYEKYLPLFSDEIGFMRNLIVEISHGYTAVRKKLSEYSPKTMPRLGKNQKTEFSEAAKTVRGFFKDDITDLREKYFLYTDEELRSLHSRYRAFSKTAFAFFTEYERRIDEEKTRRGICDFSDVERRVYSLFWDNSGNITDLARETAESYDYVYIDEYQDVNFIQHKIFEAISKETNRFMVGDIKQSIYSFRGAKPEIFAALRGSYPPLDKKADGNTASVFMSENFRSSHSVINFANSVFGVLFGVAGSDIGYRHSDDALVCSRPSNDNGTAHVRIFRSDPDSGERAEFSYVCDEIMRLTETGKKENGEKILPKDIAIMLRNGGKAQELCDMLTKRGIKTSVEDREDFFSGETVTLIISILNAVDNPERDIYLAGAMHSCVFGFTLDELTKIRTEKPDGNLYDSLLSYCSAHPEYTKGTDFITKLNSLRAYSAGIPVDMLISKLYEDTDMYVLCGDTENMRLFLDFARRFEASSFKGLYNFLSYIRQITEGGMHVRTARTDDGDDRVKIITVHHSKGLEFPICFLCDTGASYSSAMAKQNTVYDPDAGLALRFRDDSGLVYYENPIRYAVLDRIADKQVREEMRVLYVALTRPREKIYVTATTTRKISNLTGEISVLGNSPDEYSVLSLRNHISLILLALEGNPAPADVEFFEKEDLPTTAPGDEEAENGITAEPETITESPIENNANEYKFSDESATAPTAEETESGIDEKILRERLDYVYPYAHLGKIPGKLSVSRLTPTVLDGNDEPDNVNVDGLSVPSDIGKYLSGAEVTPTDAKKDVSETDCESDLQNAVLPHFMQGGNGIKATDIGNATHRFLQFCDFFLTEKNGIESEIRRLTDLGFIADGDGTLISVKQLASFFSSPLFTEMKGAKRLLRELRFNMKLPAADFTGNAELKSKLADCEILVQGVIDCVFESENGDITVVDYKTDSFRGKTARSKSEIYGILRERHTPQLNYYRAVCEKMFGREPKRVLVFSLFLGECVEIRKPPFNDASPDNNDDKYYNA